MWRLLLKVLVWIAIPSVLLAGFLVSWLGVPLLPSRAIRFSYVVSGTTHNDGKAWRLLGMGEAVYLHMPRSSKRYYQWLKVRPQHQEAIVTGPDTKLGIHWINKPGHGVDLLGGKVGDGWQAQWHEDSFRLSNKDMAIKGQLKP